MEAIVQEEVSFVQVVNDDFDLCNVPTTFTRLMNDILRHFNESFVMKYLYDILIFSNTLKKHISHVMHVLETLKKNQLIANLKKCEFRKESLIYLGHKIGGGEKRVDPDNIAAISQWIIPTNLTKVVIFI
jgi:hypothetical protein